MLKLIYEGQFLKEMKLCDKRGRDLDKLKNIIELLVEEKELPIRCRNHKLKGVYKGYLECHIEPDWLLIYKKTSSEIILSRTGTHSDLF